MNMPENLIFKQLEVGPMANYVYFIGDKKSNEIGVVDPAWDIDLIREEASKDGLIIKAILLTHGHMDHTNGVDELSSKYDVPIYISGKEGFYSEIKNIVEIKDKENIRIGNIDIECILTPGHTPGSICFKYENILISGDTLFIDGCGRCDLAGGSVEKMYDSLYNIISKMDDDTIIFAGHSYGPAPYATLASQKQTNPYLTCKSKDEFINQRM
ncbi:MAG: MBL fold metallo-hydrolase [Candidatus Zapsychrus exili]|nr:MBL fold metallo-hydrolase [Candidatus Zapsychrus exili]